MKKYFYQALLLMVAVFWTSSCIKGLSPKTDVLLHHAWIQRWLNNPVCKLPCWENITPGLTKISDASLLLRKVPNLTITYQDNEGIEWEIEKTDYGSVDAFDSQGVVSGVIISIDQEQNLMLGELKEKFGPPLFVSLDRCEQGSCIVHLIYPDLGMYFEVFLPDTGEYGQVNINSDNVITGVMFYPTGLENYKKIPTLNEKNLIEWKGYTIYP